MIEVKVGNINFESKSAGVSCFIVNPRNGDETNVQALIAGTRMGGKSHDLVSITSKNFSRAREEKDHKKGGYWTTLSVKPKTKEPILLRFKVVISEGLRPQTFTFYTMSRMNGNVAALTHENVPASEGIETQSVLVASGFVEPVELEYVQQVYPNLKVKPLVRIQLSKRDLFNERFAYNIMKKGSDAPVMIKETFTGTDGEKKVLTSPAPTVGLR